jgi:hypothetical protein
MAEDLLDLIEGHLQLAEEQDLLQVQQAFLVIVAVTIYSGTCRPQQPDFVVIAQRSGGLACQVSDFFDRIWHGGYSTA